MAGSGLVAPVHSGAVIEVHTAIGDLLPGLTESFREAFRAGEAAVTRFRQEQMVRHPAREGFRLVAASVDGDLAGFAYGYTGREGQWWTDRMHEAVPAAVYDTWFGGHFEVVELAVRPRYQRRGIGSALHDTLLEGLPHERALLTCRRDSRAARRLYLRKGWRRLADVDDVVTLMGLLLPVPPD